MIEVSVSADREGHGQTFATTKYTYDKTGNITHIVIPTGGEILREYDAADRLIAEIHKEKASKINNRTEFSYDKAGNLVEIRDNLGRRTIIEYDLMNREIRRMDKMGAIQRTMYNLDGQINKVVRPNQYEADKDDGAGYQYVYDLYGRITTIVGPDGQVIQTNVYDADGHLLQQLDGVGSGAEYGYDLAGNQTKIRTVGGTEQSFQYDAQGNIIGVVDGNLNRTEYRLDKWGRITQIIKADGSTEFYAYNYAGNITASTDGEGHTTQYEYNCMGKLAAVIDPLGEKEEYHYDGQARLISKTDRNGVTVEFGYNLYGDPLFKRAKDSTLGDFYEYTPEGLLKCAISAGMRYSYEYDGMGRLVRKSASGRTLLAMAYDKNGNKVLQTDVTGKTTEFTYSALDLLTKMCDDGRELAVYDYNPDGTIKALTHGPIRQEYGYDIDKNLSTLKVLSAGAVLTDNFYQYDGNGNRTLKRQLGGDTLYHYDPLNQLRKVEYPSYTEELFYDLAGNRTRRIASEIEELYQYDPRNRLTAYTKSGVTTPFRYDHAGNLLADDKAFYSYDAFNRTAQVETFDGNIQLNRYDAEGLRYEMEENGKLVQFIFNQDREAVVEGDTSGLNRLIRGTELIARDSGADSASLYYHYASDEMGSTTHIVDETTIVQNYYEYDAWGNVTTCKEDIPNRIKFAGQQFDSTTQQYYLRARFYNPITSRFTQEDVCQEDGLNLYVYCMSNPVKYIDPSGYTSEEGIMDALINGLLKPDSQGHIYAHNTRHDTAIKTVKVSPRAANGDVYHWGSLQSHHVLQADWAENILGPYGYVRGRAPTITLESSGGVWRIENGWHMPHNNITTRQTRYNKQFPISSSSVQDLQERLIEGASQLLEEGYDRSIVDEQLARNYRMIERLRYDNAQNIADHSLPELEYDPDEISKVLDQKYPNQKSTLVAETKKDGTNSDVNIFTKCGSGIPGGGK